LIQSAALGRGAGRSYLLQNEEDSEMSGIEEIPILRYLSSLIF